MNIKIGTSIGFIGNLNEKISQLLGFFLLTLLIETPLIILLISWSGTKLLVFELCLDCVQLIFIVVELFTSLIRSRHAIHEACREFKVSRHASIQKARAEMSDFENPMFQMDVKDRY